MHTVRVWGATVVVILGELRVQLWVNRYVCSRLGVVGWAGFILNFSTVE